MGAFIPFFILLPGVIAGAGARIVSNDIAARGKPELNMYTAILTVSINIISNIVFIPIYGLKGAALATTLSYFLNLIIKLIIYWKETGVVFTEVIFIKLNDIKLVKCALSK